MSLSLLSRMSLAGFEQYDDLKTSLEPLWSMCTMKSLDGKKGKTIILFTP
jgi:hypothetical protein